MSFGKLLLNAALYFGVATILAETAAVAALWARGAWSQEQLLKLVAIAHNVDLGRMQDQLQQAARPEASEHFSFDEIATARAAIGADLDLRQLSIDRTRDNISFLDAQADNRSRQYADLKSWFDQQLQRLRDGTPDASLLEVQRELESMSAKTAKDQLVRMLDNKRLSQASLPFVIEVLKSLPLDKRKRILAEFQGEEVVRLHEILHEIRQGIPAATLALQARQRLQELEARTLEATRP